jgi:hypothetical protein
MWVDLASHAPLPLGIAPPPCVLLIEWLRCTHASIIAGLRRGRHF